MKRVAGQDRWTVRGSAGQDEDLVLVGIGANLATDRYGPPIDACKAALGILGERGLVPTRVSPFYQSAPVPASDQPRYVNAVVAVATVLPPDRVMNLLHEIEAEFGRVRRHRNEARAMDLDLLAYGREVRPPPGWPVLPHPRLVERTFALVPLGDIAPRWHHPASGEPVGRLIARLREGAESIIRLE